MEGAPFGAPGNLRKRFRGLAAARHGSAPEALWTCLHTRCDTTWEAPRPRSGNTLGGRGSSGH
eukprot:12092092-Alexandrium_andersonii.AAC.1